MVTIIEIKPSRLLLVLITGVHAVAAFSLWFCVEPVIALGGFGLVAGSYVLALARWRNGRGSLGLTSEGDLLIDADGTARRRLKLGSGTTVTHRAVWLVWPQQNGCRGGARLLMRDQATSEAWRRLQVWTRLTAAADAQSDDGANA